jgi:DNA-binding PadR family transcriptional regulator
MIGAAMLESEIALLGLLAEKPRYGYELDKIIEARGMREWTDIAFSSIYAVLRGMEKKGLAAATTEVAGNRVRKLFSITKEGKRALREAVKSQIAEPVKQNDLMMLALANITVLSADERREAAEARIGAQKSVAVYLRKKLGENAKSPDYVRAMFERSLMLIDADIVFTEDFFLGNAVALSEVASAPSEPRNDAKRPETTEVVASPKEQAPRKDETTRNDETTRPKVEESVSDEPKDTLF